MGAVDQAHWWFVARRAILAEQIRATRGTSRADVVEIGCGAGGNLEMLGNFGALRACELDPALRDLAARRSGIAIDAGHLPDGLPYAPESADLVAALDVVEHVEEDAASVAAMAGLLRPGGTLVVTVPAYRWLWSEHDDIHEHKRRYTRSAMKRLMEAAGLEVVRSSYFNTLLFPAVAGARAIGPLLGRSGADDAAMPSPRVNAILRRIFASERHLLRLGSLPFGVSVLCIGRKL